MYASQSILCNSQQARQVNDNGNKAVFTLQYPLFINDNVRLKCALSMLKWSNVFYNIRTGANTLHTSIGDIVVTQGNYSVQALLLALSVGGFTATYSQITLKITIAHPTPFSISDGANTLHNLLGMEVDATTTTHIGVRVLRLQGVQVLQVRVPSLNIYANSAGSGASTLATVPNSVLISSVGTYVPTTPEFRTCYTQSMITDVEVEIVDESGTDINFAGSYWYAELKFEFEYVPPRPDLRNPFLEANDFLSKSIVSNQEPQPQPQNETANLAPVIQENQQSIWPDAGAPTLEVNSERP